MIESMGKNGKVIIIICIVGKFVEFCVEDIGCGILLSYLDKFFNLFFIIKFEG